MAEQVARFSKSSVRRRDELAEFSVLKPAASLRLGIRFVGTPASFQPRADIVVRQFPAATGTG